LLAVLTFYLASIELYDMSDVCALIAVDIVESIEGACEFTQPATGANAFVKYEDLLLCDFSQSIFSPELTQYHVLSSIYSLPWRIFGVEAS